MNARADRIENAMAGVSIKDFKVKFANQMKNPDEDENSSNEIKLGLKS